MHTNSIDKKLKIAIISTLFLTLTISMCALLSNTANAEEANNATEKNGEFEYRSLTIKGDKTPQENVDYIISEDKEQITINTNGWTLTGDVGTSQDVPLYLTVNLNCETISMDGLECNLDNSHVILSNPCEITLIGNDSYFASARFACDVTLIGPKKLHVYNGTCTADKSLTLKNTTLEVWTGYPQLSNKDSYPQLEVGSSGEGDLTAINSKIVASNNESVKDGKGIFLHHNVFLDENSELFAAGNEAAIYYKTSGVLSNALGNEKLYEEYKDKDKVNKPTTETLVVRTEPPYYTKTINGLNETAKTIYIKGNGSPTPEPVSPEYTTAQTGDNNLWIVLALLIVAGAGLAVFLIVRRRNKAKLHKPIHKNK